MNYIALIGVLGFAVIAAVAFYSAGLTKAGRLPFKSRLGLRGHQLLSSPEAWRTGHEAAAGLLLILGVVATGHLIGCSIAAMTSATPDTLSNALVLSGAVTCVGLRALASSAANKAASQQEH